MDLVILFFHSPCFGHNGLLSVPRISHTHSHFMVFALAASALYMDGSFDSLASNVSALEKVFIEHIPCPESLPLKKTLLLFLRVCIIRV